MKAYSSSSSFPPDSRSWKGARVARAVVPPRSTATPAAKRAPLPSSEVTTPATLAIESLATSIASLVSPPSVDPNTSWPARYAKASMASLPFSLSAAALKGPRSACLISTPLISGTRLEEVTSAKTRATPRYWSAICCAMGLAFTASSPRLATKPSIASRPLTASGADPRNPIVRASVASLVGSYAYLDVYQSGVPSMVASPAAEILEMSPNTLTSYSTNSGASSSFLFFFISARSAVTTSRTLFALTCLFKTHSLTHHETWVLETCPPNWVSCGFTTILFSL
mmetsp:Transcript_6950/g.25076  ORF Transcript_6950/g.25076 Transcript_6950/m.25076 type:complete len:283 (+) Transcript_6950:195-1043(+)